MKGTHRTKVVGGRRAVRGLLVAVLVVVLVGLPGGARNRALAADPSAANIELAAFQTFVRMVQTQHGLRSYAADFNGTMAADSVVLTFKGMLEYKGAGKAKATFHIGGDLVAFFRRLAASGVSDSEIKATLRKRGMGETVGYMCVSDGATTYLVPSWKAPVSRWSATKNRANIPKVLDKGLMFGSFLSGFLVGDPDDDRQLNRMDADAMTADDAEEYGASFGKMRLIGERPWGTGTVTVVRMTLDAYTVAAAVGTGDNTLRQVAVRGESDGKSVELVLNLYNIRQNPTLPDTDFTFTPPKGAKVEDGDDSDDES